MNDQPKSSKQCIFCDNALDAQTKPEHILLNALGGRKTTRRAICSDCNNRFGGTIDDALTKQVQVIRNMLQLESGTGKPPPALKNLHTTTEKIHIRNDGRPELASPPFKVSKQADGNASVEIAAKSEDELRRILPHIAAQIGISEADLLKQIEGSAIQTVERRPGTLHHSISLGGPDVLRSVVKSCLVLLATVTGSDAVRETAFDAARQFVNSGSEAFNKTRIVIDSREVPHVDIIKHDFGNFFNLLNVRSDESGNVIGHFTLYNVVSWQVILADSGGPKNLSVGIVSNPLNPAAWSDGIPNGVDIPFDWLSTFDRTYELDRARERFISMVQHHRDQTLAAEITRIVDDVCRKHGYTDDTAQIERAKLEEIFKECAARLGAHAAGVPHQTSLTREEIRQLLHSSI